MSNIAPELTAAGIIGNIKAGAYPREAIMTIARGFLPLPQEELIAVISYLIATAQPDIAEVAQSSLEDIPSRTIIDFAGNEAANPEFLHLLMRASRNHTVVETLIRNKAVSDQEVVALARRADAAVQEVIVINQARILRAPEILDALIENPQITPDSRRRALETREEFFEKKARLKKIADELGDAELLNDTPLEPIADLLAQAEQQEDAPPPQELPAAEQADPKKKAIWVQILSMTVSEKVQLAFKGDKTVRMILVRERNRLVASATLRNPRMTENEVEAIAGMRNVEEDVLRNVGMRREWTAKYPVLVALCRNPKVPVGVVLPLINRLALRDLKNLKDDRGVSEVVRTSARKLYQIRQKM